MNVGKANYTSLAFSYVIYRLEYNKEGQKDSVE